MPEAQQVGQQQAGQQQAARPGAAERVVIVTRPRAQAAPLAQALTAAGRTALVLPLLEITPLDDPAPLRAVLAGLERFALVAFVSPNAIDAVFAQLAAWPARVPLAIIGDGSRAALVRHGVSAERFTIFSPADSAHSDSEHLLRSLDLAAYRGQRVLIVRGDGGRELLADALRGAGALVETVAAYRRATPRLTAALGARLRTLLAQPNDWIITSSEALRGLAGLVRSLDADGGTAGLPQLMPQLMEPSMQPSMQESMPSLMAQLERQRLIVPHARIADTARALGVQDVILTGSGDASLLAALQSQ